MNKLVIIPLYIITLIPAIAQSGFIEFEGVYNGKNLYIDNPIALNGKFCSYEVYINGDVTGPETNTAQYEVDFTNFGFKIGDYVHVKILHHKGCIPKLINSRVLDVSMVIDDEITFIIPYRLATCHSTIKTENSLAILFCNQSDTIFYQRRFGYYNIPVYLNEKLLDLNAVHYSIQINDEMDRRTKDSLVKYAKKRNQELQVYSDSINDYKFEKLEERIQKEKSIKIQIFELLKLPFGKRVQTAVNVHKNGLIDFQVNVAFGNDENIRSIEFYAFGINEECLDDFIEVVETIRMIKQ